MDIEYAAYCFLVSFGIMFGGLTGVALGIAVIMRVCSVSLIGSIEAALKRIDKLDDERTGSLSDRLKAMKEAGAGAKGEGGSGSE